MENTTIRNSKVKVYYDPRTLPVAPNDTRPARLFVEHGRQSEPFKVTIKRSLGRYELRGQVDSQATREIVLSIIRTNHPHREIVDFLTICPVDSCNGDTHAA